MLKKRPFLMEFRVKMSKSTEHQKDQTLYDLNALYAKRRIVNDVDT